MRYPGGKRGSLANKVVRVHLSIQLIYLICYSKITDSVMYRVDVYCIHAEAILVQRPFNTRVLKAGLPNLLVTSPGT